MPIYEYYCEKCQSEFELLIRGGQEAECPRCGNKKPDRQMSAPAGHSRSGDYCPDRGDCPGQTHCCRPGGCCGN